jgi:hypothetical protein
MDLDVHGTPGTDIGVQNFLCASKSSGPTALSQEKPKHVPVKITRLDGIAKKPSNFERTKNMGAFPIVDL